jgi:hypothetical protein
MRLLEFQQHRQAVLDVVRAVGNKFTRPDEDWVPVVLLYDGETMHVAPLPLTEDSDKDALPALMIEAFRKFQPTFAALVLSTWVRKLNANDPSPS